MAEPKATTIAARFGFKDPELSTSKHDEILMWVEANLKQLVARQLQPEIVKGRDKSRAIDRWYKDEWSERSRHRSPRKPRPEVIAEMDAKRAALSAADVPARPVGNVMAEWEHAIMDRSFTVGFIDMMVTAKVPALGINQAGTEFAWWGHEIRIAVEAKTGVGSMGELLRQVRMYQGHRPNIKHWVLVSPPIPYETHLKSQGVDFWLYDAS